MSEVVIPTTTNLGLKKPTYDNFADVKDAVQDNMDILDEAYGNMAKVIYPVGSIYMSVTDTNPATLFPGTTWAQIKDTFLLAAGTTYAGGGTGGAATKSYTPAGTVGSHSLTSSEIPSHSHGLNGHVHSVGAHSHGLNGHVHTVGGHTHTIGSHSHTVPAHAHGLNGHTHSIPAHSHGVTNGANQGFATYDTATDHGATGTGFMTKAAGGVYYAGYSAYTASGGSGTTGAASGNTANSSAFSTSEAGGGTTGTSSAFNTGGASGSTANSSAFNTGGASGNTAAAGGGSGHSHGFTGTAANINVMPPYLTVYMWKRTA